MDPSGPTLTLVRHGATEWSVRGRHTGRTDVELTDEGRRQAARLEPLLGRVGFDLVLVSPLRRAVETAELAGVGRFELDPDLQEWDYGDLEGLTTPQIRDRYPGWSIWRGPWPGGETPTEVAGRADRVIGRALAAGTGRVALVAHGHILRALAARWLAQPAEAGAWMALDTATVSELGWEHGNRVLRRWNAPVAG
jgi:broad specificity phosphatase PhoE